MAGLLGRRRRRPFVLALCGGGGRGLAHLGVLEVLEEHGLRPSAIVGTSIGALFGSMYALNPNITEVRERLMKFLASDEFHNFGLPSLKKGRAAADDDWLSRLTSAARQSVVYAKSMMNTSLLPGDTLIQAAHALCAHSRFDEAEIPMHVIAVRFPGGECHLFSHGNLCRPIAASMAIPGVFEPIEIDGDQYVDGGLAAEIPAVEARYVAMPDEIVVAVNTGARPDPNRKPTHVLAMVDWAMQVKSLYLRNYEKQHADLVIEPLVGYTQWMDFSRIDQEIGKGRDAALEKLPELMRLAS